MTAQEYIKDCWTNRDQSIPLPAEVTDSPIGRMTDWRKSPRHPLVCIHAAGNMDPDTDSDIDLVQLTDPEPRCACWEVSDSRDSSVLMGSFMLFAEFPDVMGFDPPSFAYKQDEIVDVEQGLQTPSQFKFEGGGIPFAIFELEPAGDPFNLGPAWRHVPIHGKATPIDENQSHLMILDKAQASTSVGEMGPSSPLRGPLRYMLRRFDKETWLTIDGVEVIPILFTPKRALPARKVALNFDSFVKAIGGDYTGTSSPSSIRFRTRRQIDCTFFHDRSSGNHVSPNNPLVESEPCWLQITYSHGFNEFLDIGDELVLRLLDLQGGQIEEEKIKINEDKTSQIWIRRPSGFSSGFYQIVAKAYSGSTFHGSGCRYLRVSGAV